MEGAVIGVFCLSLVGCILSGVQIIYALIFGLILFLLYGKRKGFSWKSLLGMALEGIRTIRKILITFLLIGIMTGLWRASGTVAFLVSTAARLVRPDLFLLMVFLFNCGLSLLTGTSLGTAATMGVICAAMGASMGVSAILTGGAVLSGIYFGDRCSPVSTSALLISQVTDTDIYDNIRAMLRSALIPFLFSCAFYLLLGRGAAAADRLQDPGPVFERCFSLHWITLLPAASILLLSACRAGVRPTMLVSILISVPLCLFLQHLTPEQLFVCALKGYEAADPECGALINGGGTVSMLKVTLIVCISSSYSGLFQKTGLLDGVRKRIAMLSQKTNSYTATFLTALLSATVSCSQTLTILLTHQLCREENPDPGKFALDLEDTTALIPALIPWSVACSAPLTAVAAPQSAVLFAVYLAALPLWRLIRSSAATVRQRCGRKKNTGG